MSGSIGGGLQKRAQRWYSVVVALRVCCVVVLFDFFCANNDSIGSVVCVYSFDFQCVLVCQQFFVGVIASRCCMIDGIRTAPKEEYDSLLEYTLVCNGREEWCCVRCTTQNVWTRKRCWICRTYSTETVEVSPTSYENTSQQLRLSKWWKSRRHDHEIWIWCTVRDGRKEEQIGRRTCAGSARFCSVSLITLRSITAKTDSAKCLTAGLGDQAEATSTSVSITLSLPVLVSLPTFHQYFFSQKSCSSLCLWFFHLLPLTFVSLTFDLFSFSPVYPLLLSLATYCLPCPCRASYCASYLAPDRTPGTTPTVPLHRTLPSSWNSHMTSHLSIWHCPEVTFSLQWL